MSAVSVKEILKAQHSFLHLQQTSSLWLSVCPSSLDVEKRLPPLLGNLELRILYMPHWGTFFFNFSKVQVCQCNIGKFNGNSLIRKIVIRSRELNQIWGSTVYLDLVFRSSTVAETNGIEWGKVSNKICVEYICV